MKQELNLQSKLINTGYSQLLKQDMDKILSTSKDSNNKSQAFNKILLLLGSGASLVTGTYYKNGKVEQGIKKASKSDLPIGVYMAGHMGRNYMHFPDKNAREVLTWIAGGKKGIHNIAYSMPGNQEKQLKDKEIVFDRHSATHSAQYKNGEIKELKGFSYGFSGFISRLANPRTLATFDRYMALRVLTYPLLLTLCIVYNAVAAVGNAFGLGISYSNPFSKNSEHFGFNIGIGGENNRYISDSSKKISSDGKSGHVYLNVSGNILGVGLEGTAPNTEGPLGSHSKTGGADQFSACENEKFSIKFGSDTFKKYIVNYITAKEVKNDILDKYLIGDKIIKKELIEALKEVGLTTIKQGKKDFLLTSFGSNLIRSNNSIILPDNYNGFRINQYDQKELDAVMQCHAIPKEICYFKPQQNFKAFIKQEEIFKNIENKTILKNHPALSLNTCIKLGTLYNISHNGNNKEKEQAESKLTKILNTIKRSSSLESKKVQEIIEKHSELKALDKIVNLYISGGKYQEKCKAILENENLNILNQGLEGIAPNSSKTQQNSKNSFTERILNEKVNTPFTSAER